MTRGRRDGILKCEKTRHVVKIGPMHFKGVWIPFDRALDFANKEKITNILYPLFTLLVLVDICTTRRTPVRVVQSFWPARMPVRPKLPVSLRTQRQMQRQMQRQADRLNAVKNLNHQLFKHTGRQDQGVAPHVCCLPANRNREVNIELRLNRHLKARTYTQRGSPDLLMIMLRPGTPNSRSEDYMVPTKGKISPSVLVSTFSECVRVVSDDIAIHLTAPSRSCP